MNSYVKLLWKNQAYRTLLIGEIIVMTGDYFSYIAVLSMIQQYGGGSALLLSAAELVACLPAIIWFPFTGVVADKFNRQRILMLVPLLCAALVSAYPAANTAKTLWLVFVLDFGCYSIASFYEPARKALLPVIVPKHSLPYATTLDSISWSVTTTFATGLGGVVAAKLGRNACFYINAAMLLVGALCAGAMKVQPLLQDDSSEQEQEEQQNEEQHQVDSNDLSKALLADSPRPDYSPPPLRQSSSGPIPPQPPHPLRHPAGQVLRLNSPKHLHPAPHPHPHPAPPPVLPPLPTQRDHMDPTCMLESGDATPFQFEQHENGTCSSGWGEEQGGKGVNVNEERGWVARDVDGGSFGRAVSQFAKAVLGRDDDDDDDDDDEKGKEESMMGAMFGGFRFLAAKENRAIAAYVSIKACERLSWGAVDVLYIKMSAMESMHLLGGTEETLSLIFSVIGVSSILGPIVFNCCVSHSNTSMVVAVAISFSLMALSFGVLLISSSLPILLLSTLMSAATSATLWVAAELLLQINVPNEILGRIEAVEIALYTVAQSVSAVFAGLWFDVFHLDMSSILLTVTALAGTIAVIWCCYAGSVLTSKRSTPPLQQL